MEYDSIVITSYLNRDKIYEELANHGVNRDRIKMIFTRERVSI